MSQLDLDLDFPDEAPTVRICAECHGSSFEAFEISEGFRLEKCRWCTRGIMSAEQHALWKCIKKNECHG